MSDLEQALAYFGAHFDGAAKTNRMGMVLQDEVRRLRAELAQYATGRTMSCASCNEVVKELAQVEAESQVIIDRYNSCKAELAERTRDYQEQYQAAIDANGRALKAESVIRDRMAELNLDEWVKQLRAECKETRQERDAYCEELHKVRAELAASEKLNKELADKCIVEHDWLTAAVKKNESLFNDLAAEKMRPVVSSEGYSACGHSGYWKTLHGDCMACRVEKSEQIIRYRDEEKAVWEKHRKPGGYHPVEMLSVGEEEAARRKAESDLSIERAILFAYKSAHAKIRETLGIAGKGELGNPGDVSTLDEVERVMSDLSAAKAELQKYQKDWLCLTETHEQTLADLSQARAECANAVAAAECARVQRDRDVAEARRPLVEALKKIADQGYLSFATEKAQLLKRLDENCTRARVALKGVGE